jgi:hypothetical protein
MPSALELSFILGVYQVVLGVKVAGVWSLKYIFMEY